jgi:nitrogen-specific signal transduction histidine kinase/CheY-like chemotaxis protein
VNTDITAKKRLERQFLRSQRMESVGTLAGGIAHDLNNVLAPILMAVALLRKKLPAEPDQRLLDGLETTVKRGASLVKQVLSFSRGTEIDRAILQVRHLIDEIKKFATETFPASIEILSIVPRDLWTITGDATQIHQIILNLCVNARDAMPSGGKLTIEAKNFLADENFARVNVEAKPGPYVLISVTDTGIGIPPEIRDKIFEPFFTTKEVGKGTGLGLSTVYGIVQNHKGLIHVYSEVERGTRFHIYLPATHDEARKETPLQPQAQHHGSDELVLVVDDERAVCEVARLTLENNGYRVVTAADGAEALSIYLQKQKDITVVITDVNMPIMDGSALIRAIRRLDPGIRIVVSTGLSDSAKVAEIPRSEVQGILHKPFTAEGLLTLMDEVLHSGPSRER